MRTSSNVLYWKDFPKQRDIASAAIAGEVDEGQFWYACWNQASMYHIAVIRVSTWTQ